MDAAIYPDHQGAMRWWIGAGWTDQIMGQTAVAQELKKKRGVLKWLPLALLLVAASCGALIEAGSEDTAPTPASMSSDTSTDTDPEPSGPPTYEVGEKARDHAYQFTVTKIRCGVKRVGDSYYGEKAQGQFCLVSLRVKNVGKDPINFSDDNQALYDTKGREYSPDDEAWIHLDTDPYAEINPGNRLKTVVPFDIPKKAKPDHLLLKAGFWGASEGVMVEL